MSRVLTDPNAADDPSKEHVDLLESVGCSRQQLDVQLMWDALLDFSLGEALTSNAFPLKKVGCDSSFNVSGLAIRLNWCLFCISTF